MKRLLISLAVIGTIGFLSWGVGGCSGGSTATPEALDAPQVTGAYFCIAVGTELIGLNESCESHNDGSCIYLDSLAVFSDVLGSEAGTLSVTFTNLEGESFAAEGMIDENGLYTIASGDTFQCEGQFAEAEEDDNSEIDSDDDVLVTMTCTISGTECLTMAYSRE